MANNNEEEKRGGKKRKRRSLLPPLPEILISADEEDYLRAKLRGDFGDCLGPLEEENIRRQLRIDDDDDGDQEEEGEE